MLFVELLRIIRISGDREDISTYINVNYQVMRYTFIMVADDISAESLLNMILDKVDDIIVINDADMNIIWMNSSAQRRLGRSLEDVAGMKCYKLFGATCCCDNCIADHTFGGPHRRCDCKFVCKNRTGEYECEPVPYYKEGKLKIIVQHIRPANKNE